MSHKRKGHLTVSGEWAKHLRKFRRRQFWKGERIAGKQMIKSETKINDNFLPGKPLSDVQLSKLIDESPKVAI